MFTRRDYLLLTISLLLIATGYGCMLLDPTPQGFGPLTRWIAPPLLLTGFALPLAAIPGKEVKSLLPASFKTAWPKHIAGLMVFVTALATYLLTLEPTASLWDCAEFIASAYKLEVPHTPGTPLSLLLGRLFTMIAGGDTSRVAICMNAMSGVFSALTVYLVFYLIVYFGERLNTVRPLPSAVVILAAAGGSLCLTFSDTFWFSAVEAETYGPACFFMVALLWLILRSDHITDALRGRWLVLIFYVAGLAYCVHPMCVLTLPLLPVVWINRGHKLSIIRIALTLVAGLTLVMVINRAVAVGIFEVAFSWDLFLVNTLHLPFYSGVVLLLTVLAAAIVYVIRRWPNAQPYAWAVVFLLLGFTPYLMLFIRSAHNPPIDEGNPENLPLSKAYMNRESYPSSPLLTGPYFDAQITDVTAGKDVYYKTSDGYRVAGSMSEYQYDPARTTIFPRLYSNDQEHIAAYRNWTGLRDGEKPNMADNLRFMFTYQLGHMYFRYLLWNFAGREGDEYDSRWLKPWDALQIMQDPRYENRARNQYWMIPLLLGIAGLAFQGMADRKGFVNNLLFFLLTGVILVVYLNSYPQEPRERDYIYVGSYIAYAIWVGLGSLALGNLLASKRASITLSAITALMVPAWMAFQNLDDHDRSGRTMQIDNARNVLDSCEPGSILFTGGDNDTFPLWYLQEVEGFRTDVRVVVLSYFNSDWYINQLRRSYYQSPSFALSLGEADYLQYGPNDVLYVRDMVKGSVDVANYLALLKQGHPALRAQASNGELFTVVPSSRLTLRLDTTGVHVPAGHEPVQELSFHINGNYITKNALAFLDLLISNQWRRPIYFNFTSLHSMDLDLIPHVIQEGAVYRLAPIKNQSDEPMMDTQRAYQNLIEKADYSNLSDSSVYFNYEDYQARIIAPARYALNALALALLQEDNHTKAEAVLNTMLSKLYPTHLDPGYAGLQTAALLRTAGMETAAHRLCTELFELHYDRMQADKQRNIPSEKITEYLAQQAAMLLEQWGDNRYQTRLAQRDH